MKASRRWLILAAPILLVVLWCLWWVGGNSMGYCHREHRFLAEEELISRALQRVIQSYPPAMEVYELSDGRKELQYQRHPSNPIAYSDTAELVRLNPNCCQVTDAAREGYTGPWLSRLRGTLSNWVRVSYLVKYRDSDGDVIEQPYDAYVPLSACGDVWPGL